MTFTSYGTFLYPNTGQQSDKALSFCHSIECREVHIWLRMPLPLP